MISSKSDYRYYLGCDYRATGIDKIKLRCGLIDRRFTFYRSLRRTEYYTNCKKSLLGKLVAKFYRYRHRVLCDRYNWTIPINVFGEGLAIVHVGTIVVSNKAKIGKNCRIHVCVNIGSAWVNGKAGAPIIGDNVYIAPGVKIFGPIEIGNDVAIGANAVVNSSFPHGNCTIAGIPARVISANNSSKYIIK